MLVLGFCLKFFIFIDSSRSNIPIFLSSLSVLTLNLCSSTLSCSFLISFTLSSYSDSALNFCSATLSSRSLYSFSSLSCPFRFSDNSANSDKMLLAEDLDFFWNDRPPLTLRFAGVTISVLLTFYVLLKGSAALSSMSETSKLSLTSIVEMMDKGVVLGLSPITSTSS